MTIDIGTLSEQVTQLIAENRRLLKKSEADDTTIHLLKQQNEALRSSWEDMVEDHRRIERDLSNDRDRHVVAYTEIDGLLHQVADLILQTTRARVGNSTPEKMPQRQHPIVDDARIPRLSDWAGA